MAASSKITEQEALYHARLTPVTDRLVGMAFPEPLEAVARLLGGRYKVKKKKRQQGGDDRQMCGYATRHLPPPPPTAAGGRGGGRFARFFSHTPTSFSLSLP